MKELTEDEVLKILPRLSAVKFILEKSSRYMHTDGYYMLQCMNGWSFVGWALSRDVDFREMCPFVCMFEQEDGTQSWCHSTLIPMEMIAYDLVEKNPKLLESL
jgi:hypothetical protein